MYLIKKNLNRTEVLDLYIPVLSERYLTCYYPQSSQKVCAAFLLYNVGFCIVLISIAPDCQPIVKS